jgi:hypothetical protein
VVVVGLGPLGEAVVTGVAWRWARASLGQAGRVRISVYAPEAERRAATLGRSFPQLASSAELTAHDIDAARPAFDPAALFGASDDPPSIAYVCMDDDSSSLVAGLSFFRATREAGLPVVVCMMSDDGVASLLESAMGSEYQALRGFPLLERTCGADIVFGRIARRIHEKYVENAARDGRTRGSEPSLLPWD